MHMLLIDDEPITTFLTERLLRHEGLSDTAASFQSPTEALTFLLRQIPAGLVPQVILLDLNMPSEDGRDALRLIRNDERLACVPLVVLSASANPRDVQFAYTSGVNAYHIKPVNHASHLGILQKIFDYWLVDILLPTQRSLKPS